MEKKEAMKILKDFYDKSALFSIKTALDTVIPELKESEGEVDKIRNNLIALFKYEFGTNSNARFAGIKVKDIIAWLEKKGKPDICFRKPHQGDKSNPYDMSSSEAEAYTSKRGFDIPWMDDEVFVDERYITQTVGNILRWADDNPKQKSADKIEPKFKVGDIIRHKKQGFTCTIIAIDTEYRLSGCNGNHLPFDSQDAYELVEQKPAWSEEDEKILDGVITNYESGYLPSVEKRDEIIEKLKSLKYRHTWKPSDEQIKVCKEVYADILSAKGFDLGTVNSELNRLEEELKS